MLCTLTLHHFNDKELHFFVTKFTELATLGVIINDLERNSLAYTLFKGFSAFFIKSKVAYEDGLTSITKGFKRKELTEYAQKIPNYQHVISWRWAFRWLWLITPKAAKI